MTTETLELHKGESFAIGLSVGVCIALAVMYLPLQDSDKKLAERLDKLEKKR